MNRFILTLLLTMLVLNALVWLMLWLRARRTQWQWALHGFFVLQFVFLWLFFRGAARGIMVDRNVAMQAFIVVGYLWNLLLLPVFFVGALISVIVNAFRCLLTLLRGRQERRAQLAAARQREESHEVAVSRRQFLAGAAALLPALATFPLSIYAGSTMRSFRIRELTIPLPTLPAALDGMTISHLADLHVGFFSSPKALRDIVEASNALEADLTVFAGDLVTNSALWIPDAIETLRQLRPAVILCEGNHDIVVRNFRKTVKASGLRLLVNEAVTEKIRGVPVQILGLPWTPLDEEKNFPTVTMRMLLRQRDPAAFPILLAHHPHAWDHCDDIPLTLAGHTHGGQLMLTPSIGFGPWMYRYWSGLYTRPDSALVVSNGTGNWFPLRTCAPMEIIHITLRCA